MTDLEDIESRACPACGSSAYHLLDWEFSGLGDSIFNYTANFFSCTTCGLVYVHNINDQKLAKFYADECSYFEKNHFDIHNPSNINKYAFYFRFLQYYGLISIDMADIGCGRGGFVKWLAHGRWNGKCWGVDVDAKSIPTDSILNNNPSFKVGGAVNLPFSDASLDLVTYFHVLEHICDLHGLLEEAARVLKVDGHILIEVPDAENYHTQPIGTAFWVSIREHIYHFTATALVLALHAHGFQVLQVSRQNLPTPEFSYPSLMLLARKVRKKNKPLLPPYASLASFVLDSKQALVQQANKILSLSNDNKITFWGCSSELFSLLPLLSSRQDIQICDSSKLKQKTHYKKIAIQDPSDLPVEGALFIAPYLYIIAIKSAACQLGWPESAIHFLK